MPRSGWLALGAIAAAWTAATVSLSWAVALTVLGAAAVVAAWAVRAERVDRAGRVALVGAGLVVARLLLGGVGEVAATNGVPEGRGPWTFIVETTGAARDGNQTATLRSESLEQPGIRVAATLPAYPAVVSGDIVTLEGPIRPRPDSPYGDYLERIGAVGTLTARSIEVAPRLVDAGHVIEDARQAAATALATVLPEPEAGLAAGILIGLRDRVDRDLAAAFTTAGVSHVVAISGWNIAIVAAAVAAVAGRMGRRRRSIVTMAAIVAYVVFAGASASVVRAGAMAGVVLLARESGRAGRAAAALGWAAAILLVADPGLVGDAGFQLSALATAGLIAWATPTTAGIERLGRGRVPHWLAESLGVSLAAQLATLPVILVAFGRLAILAPAVNLVIVPLVAPAMAAGIVALLGGGIVVAGTPPVIGAILAIPGWVSLRLMVAIVDTTAAIPFASVTLPAPLAWTLAVGSIVAVVVVRVRWSRRVPRVSARPSIARGPVRLRSVATPASRATRIALVSLAGSVVIGGAVLVSRSAGVPHVSVLDVGQGDAILVEGSRGGRLLIDGGPDPARLLIDLDERVPPWDRRIDAVVLTHPHEDHVAGLARLLDRYRVGRVLEPGMRGPGPGYAAWLARLTTATAPVHLGLAQGDRLTVDEIELRVLWPVRGDVPTEPPDGGTGINNVSIVVLGAVGPYRMLLAGDVEQAIDPELLAQRLPRLDFLKVAHHGSKTATTQAFVDAVRPKVAVASAGTGNPYGHPAPATLERLAAAGARVFRTDLDGTVVATFGPEGMGVRAEGGRPVPARATTPTARAATFRCGIPAGALIPEREAAAGTTPAAVQPRSTTTVGYHRADDGPGARGRRLPPALPGTPALVRAARARGGRGRRLAGGAHRRPRDRGGPPARRGRRPAPRRGQGPPGRRSGARPPPRRGVG
jgi:competence protein ComEC